MDIFPRESVVFAENFQAVIKWYQEVLGFKIKSLFEDDYHYCYLENDHGIKLGIADAKEMNIKPADRKNNSVVLQFMVSDVKEFLLHLSSHGGSITFGPSYEKKGAFWYGGFEDIEGNPFWVVDSNCP